MQESGADVLSPKRLKIKSLTANPKEGGFCENIMSQSINPETEKGSECVASLSSQQTLPNGLVLTVVDVRNGREIGPMTLLSPEIPIVADGRPTFHIIDPGSEEEGLREVSWRNALMGNVKGVWSLDQHRIKGPEATPTFKGRLG